MTTRLDLMLGLDPSIPVPLLVPVEKPSRNTWKPMSEVVREGRLETGKRRGRVIARQLGHVLSDWQADEPHCAVATCLVCEQYAAVDATPGQPREFCGRALNRKCEGDPIW